MKGLILIRFGKYKQVFSNEMWEFANDNCINDAIDYHLLSRSNPFLGI